MTIHLTNGLGGTTGDSLALASDISVSSAVYYVDSQTGDSGNSGKDRLHPLDSVASAVALAGAHGIVVILDGHTETLTSVTLISTDGVTIIGEGSSGGVPTVELTMNHASNDMLVLAGDRIQLRNVKIKPPAVASTGNMISLTGSDSFLKDVYVEVNKNSDAAAVWLDTSGQDRRFEGCTFISTETSTAEADRPYSPVEVEATSTQTGIFMDGCVFDAGATGFKAGSNYYAFEATGTVTGVMMENISLLRGAGIKLGASSTGYVGVSTSTGHAEVEW